jgi:cyclopropane fatty-acyl-phospholipid synthase-like methyltransferase
VSSRSEAFHYVEDRIADHLAQLTVPGVPHVVDLGCGVGASLSYLAGRLAIRGTGITLSPVQARLAQERIQQAGLSDRVRCLEGDYCALPDDVATADLAFAIESFVHGPSPERFFAECRRLVRPGGLLVICDDFRRQADGAHAAAAIDAFVRGWHINTLLEPQSFRAIADAAGFAHESTVDLSPWLELRRPRDRAVDALLSLCRWLPLDVSRLGPLTGGSALQHCLARGWVGYDLAVFRRAV